MSLDAYLLRHGSVTKSLRAWGFEEAVLTLAVGGEDGLELRAAVPITSSPALTVFGRVELFDQGGTRRFRGTVLPHREGYRVGYSCPGANWLLGRAPFLSQFKFWDGSSFTLQDIVAHLHGRHPVNSELTACFAAANAALGAGEVALSASDLPTYRNPEEYQQSDQVLHVVKRILAWSPHLDYVWQYGSVPTMRVFSVLRPGHGYGDLAANTLGTKTVSVTDFEQGPVFNPRYDLLQNELRVYWKSLEASVDGGQLRWKREVDPAFASPPNDAPGFLAVQLDLRRSVFNGTVTPGNAELKVENLALRLGAPFFDLWKDFAGTLKGRTCDFSFEPGMLLNVTDGDPLYAEAKSVIRRVVHDLKAGTTSVECGAPPTLWLHDPRLTARLRNGSEAQDVGGQDYGFENNPDDGAGSSAILAANIEGAPGQYTGDGTLTLL